MSGASSILAMPVQLQGNHNTLLAAAAMAGDLSSEWVESSGQGGGTIYVRWGGAPTGAFHLFSSNEPTPTDDGFEATNDNYLTFRVGDADPTGAPGTTVYTLSYYKARWYRLAYTHTSGSGVVSAWSYL